MRTALKLDEAYIEFIINHAKPARHGESNRIEGVDTGEIAKRSWIIMNRCLEYLNWIEIATLGIVFIQAVIYGIQARLMRKAIDASKESSERQLRAYLTFSNFEKGTPTGNNIPTYVVVFKNTGQTPAYRVVAKGSVSSLEIPQPDNFRIQPIPKELCSGTLYVGPQDVFTLRCDPGGHQTEGEGHCISWAASNTLTPSKRPDIPIFASFSIPH